MAQNFEGIFAQIPSVEPALETRDPVLKGEGKNNMVPQYREWEKASIDGIFTE